MLLSIDIPYKKEQWQAHYCCETINANSIGIMGRSGSGKSTLMRLISGLEKATLGCLKLNDVHWLNQGNSLAPQLRNVAYVTQDCLLFPHLTIHKNLTLACKKSRLSQTEQTKLLEETGVINWLNKVPSELSGGQRQRVALVQALLQTPALLLCDEPLSALDAQSRYELILILKRFICAYSIPMIYISHSDNEIKALTEYCLVIEEGEIVQSDSTENIFSAPAPSGRENSHNSSVIIPFKVINTDLNEQSTVLTLIDTCGVLTTTQAYLSSYTEENKRKINDVIHIEISSSEVVLSQKIIEQSNLDNYLTCHVIDVFEEEQGYTVCVGFYGHRLHSRLSKRSYQYLSAKQGDKLYLHYNIK